jgi:hypothetical protein
MGATAQDPKPPNQVPSSLEQVKSRPLVREVSKVEEFVSTAHDFSIVTGGPVYDFLFRIGLVRLGLPNVLRRIIALIALTWLPLLILSVTSGLAFGHQVKIPFIYDYSMYARFLLALPLLVLAEIVIDPAIRSAVQDFVDDGIVQERAVKVRGSAPQDSAVTGLGHPGAFATCAGFCPHVFVSARVGIGRGVQLAHDCSQAQPSRMVVRDHQRPNTSLPHLSLALPLFHLGFVAVEDYSAGPASHSNPSRSRGGPGIS